MTNIAAAQTLANLDMDSMVTATSTGDMTSIRHQTGRTLTERELGLVRCVGIGEIQEAMRIVRERMDDALRDVDAIETASQILSAYRKSDNETTGEIHPRMSPHDKSRCDEAVQRIGGMRR